jgi:HAD superfamily hydrolase (TIGR01490 family)
MKKRIKEKAAFFDIDNTLIKGNLQLIYTLFFLKKKYFKFIPLIKLFYYATLYEFKMIKCHFVEKSGLPFLAGIKKQDLDELMKLYSNQIYETAIKKRLNQKVLFEMNRLKQEGYKIIILSAVPEFFIKNIAEKLGIKDYIGSKLHTAYDKFTGKIDFFCYDINKLKAMKKFANKHNIDLKESYSFGDSFTDRKELGFVGYPVAVNPDFRLKKYAKHNDWVILN